MKYSKSAALNIPANLENSAVATGLEKVSFIPIPKKGNAKECSKYRTITLISHASKVMLKIQIANIRWIMEKAREFQKNIYLCFIDYAKAVWITINCGKFLKLWEYQTTLPASWEIYMQVKKQQLELDMEQQTGSK